jgi:hypothetical protein
MDLFLEMEINQVHLAVSLPHPMDNQEQEHHQGPKMVNQERELAHILRDFLVTLETQPCLQSDIPIKTEHPHHHLQGFLEHLSHQDLHWYVDHFDKRNVRIASKLYHI